MVQPVTTPFSSQPVKAVNLVAPSDLSNLVAASETIRRLSHPDYPQGMRADNVKTHTLRLVHSALTIQLPAGLQSARPNLARTLWLHDLPEIPNAAGQDVSAVSQHDDPALARKVEAQELQVARRLFAPPDLELYTQFETARHVLAGLVEPPPGLAPEAYIARILDIGDGEAGFYHFLAAWIRDPDFDGTMPTSRPYEFTLARYQALHQAIEQLQLSSPLRSICRGQLLDQMDFISSTLAPIKNSLPGAGHKLISGLGALT